MRTEILTNRLAIKALNYYGYEFNPDRRFIPVDIVVISPVIQYPDSMLEFMTFEDIKILN